MLWEHKGDVAWIFGQRALPMKVITAVLGSSHLMVEVVSTKHFCRDLQCGGVVKAAWVGLLRMAEGTCASAAWIDVEMAAGTCMQCTALAMLPQVFDDVL